MIEYIIRSLKFQSTLPRGERHMPMTTRGSWFLFQSTLPRGERLLPRGQAERVRGVSIHAPTGGATVARD